MKMRRDFRQESQACRGIETASAGLFLNSKEANTTSRARGKEMQLGRQTWARSREPRRGPQGSPQV